VEEGVRALQNRMASDVARYKKYYNLYPYDERQFDYAVDTTRITPEQVLDEILAFLHNRGVDMAK
jgi:cytidylate kinase